MKGVNLHAESICFVDTNIWLYSFIESQDNEKSKIAQSIISGSEVIISTQIVNEMSVNLLKKANFSEDKIQQLIQSLYKRYTVIELTPDILLRASEIRARFSFSFWDSLVAACALDSDAEFLISEDMQSGFKFDQQLTIINPFN